MRELLFRSWNTQTNKMKYLAPGSGLEPSQFVIYMQYIGITDKNEDWVYEGDIVKLTLPNKKMSINYIVKYCEDCAYYLLECVTDNMELDTFCGYAKDQIEVIGNIYENPELLQ